MPKRRLSTHPSNPAFTEVSGEVGRELIREQHTQAALEPSEGNLLPVSGPQEPRIHEKPLSRSQAPLPHLSLEDLYTQLHP